MPMTLVAGGIPSTSKFSVAYSYPSALLRILQSLFVNLDPGLYRDPLFLGLILFPVIGYSLVCRRLLQEQSGKNILKLRKETPRVMHPGSLAYLAGVLF